MSCHAVTARKPPPSGAALLRVLVLAVLLAPASPQALAAVNDVFPGDYYPLAEGTTSSATYLIHRRQTGPLAGGRQLTDGHLDSTIVAQRFSHVMRAGGMLVAPLVVFSWVDSQVQPAALATAIGGEARGMGDLRLGVAAWPLVDRQNGRYLGVSAMLAAPTGDYDGSRQLNTGENRWRFVLGGGWQQQLSEQLILELSPELAVYGSNDDHPGGDVYRQSPSYALTGYLRYRLTPHWHVHLGAQGNWGGSGELDAVDLENPARNTRVTAGVTWITDSGQWILRLGRDSSVDHGFRTDAEVALRYLFRF